MILRYADAQNVMILKNTMNNKRYDVNAIIAYIIEHNKNSSCTSKIDISPEDRGKWTEFGCALKILGYGVDTFFALSRDDCDYSACVNVWRKEKHPETAFRFKGSYNPVGLAKFIVVDHAKAKMDLAPFVLRNGEREQQPTTRPTIMTPQEFEKPREPFSEDVLKQSQRHCKETALYHWFCSLDWLSTSDVDRIFELYRIGGSKYGKDYFNSFCGTAFPYINREGVCYSFKLVVYNPDTGKSKSNEGKRYGIMTKGGCAPCFFGEHLLQLRPDAPVEIVESEKTALMAAIYYPDKIWLACGGLEQLNENKIKTLKGRKIILCPDRDGYAKWREFAKKLFSLGYEVAITEVLHKNPGGVKDDICDLIVCFEENKRKEQIQAEKQGKPQQAHPAKLSEKIVTLWQDFLETFPGAQNFADEFNLTLLNVFENVDKTFDGVHV